MNTERQLVTVRTVSDLLPIPGADLIEVAQVDGWRCVVKKGVFKIGDPALYFEIDSILPSNIPQFEFLTKNKKPHRLKTIRLRKQLSQGLLMPFSEFPELAATVTSLDDIAAYLGVIKYAPELPAQLRGKAIGNFPPFLRKTDQERVQNIVSEVFVDRWDKLYEVTEKLDGSSMTLYNQDGRTGVCSRNLDLDIEGSPDNVMVLMYQKYKAAMERHKNIAIQGEIIGPGIQGNKYNLIEHRFFVFDVFDIESGYYMSPATRHKILQDFLPEFEHVPVLNDKTGFTSLPLLLERADGESVVCAGVQREGLVFKAVEGGFSFKVISNAWLERNE